MKNKYIFRSIKIDFMKKIIHCINTLFFLLILNFTLNAQQEKPQCYVDAYAMLKNGQQEPVAKIIVEEFLTSKFFTLLNYVFFDENSAEIPRRYHTLTKPEETKYFNPETQFINFEILDVYYDILNIIGYRLNLNPSQKISITGCNSNSSAELGNLELSRKRAEAIKNYLIKIWAVAEERITISEPRNLPQEPSLSKINPALSDEENRRVEITGEWELMKPLVVNDTIRASNPPAINFLTEVKSAKPVKSWKLSIKQSGIDLRKPITGNGLPQKNIPWRINREKDNMPTGKLPIVYWLEATADLRNKSENKQLPVEQISITTKKKTRMQSKEYQRYNLILFGFKSEDIGPHNKRIIDLIMKNIELKDSTKFYVSGYTDLTGSDETNKKLSFGRANQTSKELQKFKVSANVITVKGLGNSNNPYYKSSIENLSVVGGQYVDFSSEEQNQYETDISEIGANYNKNPEGRYYCRTVVIEVENPVEYR